MLKLVRGMPGLIALLAAAGCCVQCQSCQPIVFRVTEIGTCRGYDEAARTPVEITDVFSPDDERIYMYYYLETTVDLSLSYRWYHEDTLIYARQDGGLVEGYYLSWISRPEDERFPVGSYRVEILSGHSVLAATGFRVAEGAQPGR